jgi:hypothetical protein
MKLSKMSLIAVPVLALVLMGADGGCSGSSDDESDGSSGNADDPVVVQEGESFTFGNWEVKEGWKLTKNSFVGYSANLTVKNVSDGDDTGFFNIRLLNGSNVVADIQCNTSELGAGESTKANCIADGQAKKSYKTIEVENTM